MRKYWDVIVLHTRTDDKLYIYECIF